MYIARISDYGDKQSLKEHLYGVAELSRSFAIEELKEYCYLTGLLHDVGKYQASFQRRLKGSNERVDHSTPGAQLVREILGEGGKSSYSLMMQLCIMGHHTGLPDMGTRYDSSGEPTFYGRLKKEAEDISAWKDELKVSKSNDEKQIMTLLMQDLMPEGNPTKITNTDEKIIRAGLVNKFAFFTRFIFSCLVDADSIDAANFASTQQMQAAESDFPACLDKVEQKLSKFKRETELQKTRSKLQAQVYEKIDMDGEVFFMNMPTGSGKTICSIKFALSRRKKRIIYIIPYNSIIDQTADEFEKMFKDKAQIIRSQSTFSYDKDTYGEDFAKSMELAAENWNGDFILTTAVNFFESLYSNKRRKLRKVHNIKDAVLVFDEVHTLPQKFLKPCLEVISYLCKYCGCEAVFLTATMPNFKELFQELALPNMQTVNLIDDYSDFAKFKKAQFNFIGEISDEELIKRASQSPATLIIVNSKKAAREIYKDLRGDKYHLSTYMIANDRMDTIKTIKEKLKQLQDDFPTGDVPEERRISVVSTSLVEAGVDLDFHTVFRELAGLENILQAGGRCNREGLRKKGDVFIFQRTEDTNKTLSERQSLALNIIKKYEDIDDPNAILEYYDELFTFNNQLLSSMSMDKYANSIREIPFASYAEKFRLIDQGSISIIAPVGEGNKLINKMKYSGVVDFSRAHQYSFTVNINEFQQLLQSRRIEDFDTGVYVLRDEKYYDKEIGVILEQKQMSFGSNSGYLL